MYLAKAGEKWCQGKQRVLCEGNKRQLLEMRDRYPWLEGMESAERYQYQIAKSISSYTSFMGMTPNGS